MSGTYRQILREYSAPPEFKFLENGRAYYAKCPKSMCYSKDSFERLLECYSLRREVLFGSEAAFFLAEMARPTAPTTGRPRIPYLEQYRAELPREDYQEKEETRVREGGEEFVE